WPTIARMAVDILPAQATSVSCERMFSSSGETASSLRARLGSVKFEELQLMKARWR
ncbi:hypothetical protein BDZ89DRAFT_909044, partial [Hymenopellis radicata]